MGFQTKIVPTGTSRCRDLIATCRQALVSSSYYRSSAVGVVIVAILNIIKNFKLERKFLKNAIVLYIRIILYTCKLLPM